MCIENHMVQPFADDGAEMLTECICGNTYSHNGRMCRECLIEMHEQRVADELVDVIGDIALFKHQAD